ncbi:uncharacterized protein EV154DRAFT_453471, partial [Mucor mucedo]|uniref:uncharacterized protein n=1 Tax=Mucor mucedo TaxID=29922 RepID=UPI002220E900
MNNASSSKSVTLADQDLQRDIDNAVQLERNSQMIVAERNEVRPKNTSRSYYSRQEEWKTWCIDQKFTDGVTVNDRKLSLFLREFIVPRGRKTERNTDGSAIPLGRESINSYVKACMDLQSQQLALNNETRAVNRGPLVVAFME